MVTVTAISEIHRWRWIKDESAPEDILVELLEDKLELILRANPSMRGRCYRNGGWKREDGSSFQDECLVCWRHSIPELTERFKEKKLLSPDTTLEAFCTTVKANDREMNEVRAKL